MKLAKILDMSDTTMRRIAEEDVHLKFYVKNSINVLRLSR